MKATSLSVLIVDDDQSLRESLAAMLQHSGYSAVGAASAEAGLKILESNEIDIVLCDLRMPELDGFDFLKRCAASKSDTAVILMTAYGDHDVAIEAMKHGAYDYISKPFSADELIFTLRKVEEREQLKAENSELRSVITRRYSFSNITAQSKSMLQIFETIKRMADFRTTVMISGESGTGKELIARAIHYNSSRRGKAFVAINCGAIPENLMESELFGHKKGAFTDASRDKRGLFEEADGGTIFLDEVGELPLHLQVKLLRALQEQKIRSVGDEIEKSINARVIAATHRDLEDDVKCGKFRDDLYYRLHVVAIHVPPLRERPEDIAVLIEHFLKKHNKQLGLNVASVEPDAQKRLLAYSWPGNVRELENAIERSMVLCNGEAISIDNLPPRVRSHNVNTNIEERTDSVSDDDLSIKKRVRNIEISLILKALERTNGNRTHAAKLLEISHRTLLYKLKEYELSDIGKEIEEAEAP